MALIGMQLPFALFLGSPVGVFLGMPPWLAPSEVLMGGLLLWIFLLGTSMPPCVNFLVLLVVLMFMDSIVHKLNPVRHELLHLWRTFVACSIVLGKTILCLIFFTLLFWGCMHYGICSVSLMVLCTIRLLRVVTMLLYCLAYCELPLLSLVGIMVCGCNLMLQICGCRMIGRE